MDTRLPAADEQTTTACYVYGIVPAGLQPDPDVLGVGQPPAPVTTVVHDAVAALVSMVDVEQRMGSADDLWAHQHVLDAAARQGPVLPMRFGAVVASVEAVTNELLADGDQEFRAALETIGDRVEFVVKGRYVQDAVLRDIVTANPEAARLREQIQGRSEDATRPERIALGEIIESAVHDRRDNDTATAQDVVADLVATSQVREPGHEWEAVNLAVLVDRAHEDQLRAVIGQLADQWQGRVAIRLLGPLAPYDFASG